MTNVAGLKRGRQAAFEVGEEDLAVHRPLDYERRGDGVVAQACDEGRRLPITLWHFADQRSPRRQRPRERAMLVAAPVSSTKTSFAGSSEAYFAFQLCRAAAMSSLSCSAARTVLWDGPPPPTVRRAMVTMELPPPHEEDHPMTIKTLGIDIGKSVLHLVGLDGRGHVVLRKRLSNTMDAGFCVEALAEALARDATPEIFNTDQGSQFTSLDFTCTLGDAGVAISMDGRGRYLDNIFIERLWRSLKYEAVYLHELTDGFKAERIIGEWIDFYNTERPHSALDGQTPAEAYGAGRPADMMDKPDGLPLNARVQAPQAQQQQDVINRILAA